MSCTTAAAHCAMPDGTRQQAHQTRRLVGLAPRDTGARRARLPAHAVASARLADTGARAKRTHRARVAARQGATAKPGRRRGAVPRRARLGALPARALPSALHVSMATLAQLRVPPRANDAPLGSILDIPLRARHLARCVPPGSYRRSQGNPIAICARMASICLRCRGISVLEKGARLALRVKRASFVSDAPAGLLDFALRVPRVSTSLSMLHARR